MSRVDSSSLRQGGGVGTHGGPKQNILANAMAEVQGFRMDTVSLNEEGELIASLAYIPTMEDYVIGSFVVALGGIEHANIKIANTHAMNVIYFPEGNPEDGDTVVINGVTFTAAIDPDDVAPRNRKFLTYESGSHEADLVANLREAYYSYFNAPSNRASKVVDAYTMTDYQLVEEEWNNSFVYNTVKEWAHDGQYTEEQEALLLMATTPGEDGNSYTLTVSGSFGIGGTTFSGGLDYGGFFGNSGPSYDGLTAVVLWISRASTSLEGEGGGEGGGPSA